MDATIFVQWNQETPGVLAPTKFVSTHRNLVFYNRNVLLVNYIPRTLSKFSQPCICVQAKQYFFNLIELGFAGNLFQETRRAKLF